MCLDDVLCTSLNKSSVCQKKTENDVWGNKRKSRFRLDEPDTREKIKATLQ